MSRNYPAHAQRKNDSDLSGKLLGIHLFTFYYCIVTIGTGCFPKHRILRNNIVTANRTDSSILTAQEVDDLIRRVDHLENRTTF